MNQQMEKASRLHLKKANCISECFLFNIVPGTETFCFVYLYSENTYSEVAAMSKWQNQSYEPGMEKCND
jgi:hypothetical protein